MTDVFFMKSKVLRDKLPRVYELEAGRYQVDLRGKRLEPLRLALTDGKKRLNFTNKAEALAKAAELESVLLTHGKERLNDLSQFVSNGEVTKYAQALAIHGKTLVDASKFYLDHLERLEEINRSRPISELLDKWLEARRNNRNKPLRPRSLGNLVSRSNLIKETFGSKRLLEVTAEDVEKWTNDMPQSSQTREHYRNVLGQFFNWCRKKKYCQSNPCSLVDIDVENERPKFLSPADTKRVLAFISSSPVYRSYLPMHLVGFFAGVRVAEASQLQWNDINLEQCYILVPFTVAKGKHERKIELEPNLVASLKQWKEMHPSEPFAPKRNIPDGLKRLRKNLEKLGIDWPHNVMRHSYASYFLSKYESFDRLETYMGNSKAVLETHYLRTPTKQAAEDYFSITVED